MNIAAEKAEIIKRFNQVEDVAVIKAIKRLLDAGPGTHTNNWETLEEALKIAVMQSKNREVMPHKEVWGEIPKKI